MPALADERPFRSRVVVSFHAGKSSIRTARKSVPSATTAATPSHASSGTP
jgi:hypothetical protein